MGEASRLKVDDGAQVYCHSPIALRFWLSGQALDGVSGPSRKLSFDDERASRDWPQSQRNRPRLP